MNDFFDHLCVRLEKLRDKLAEVEHERRELRKRVRELENVIAVMEEENDG